MKTIHRERLLISFMILASIPVFSYLYLSGYHDAVFGYNWLARLVAKICASCYFIFAFPNIILYKLHLLQNMIGFTLGVSTGALSHSFLIEFLIRAYQKRTATDDEDLEI